MDNTEEKIKLEFANTIYEKQHYFIDRHEIMAEKLFTFLLILTSVITISVVLNNDVISINPLLVLLPLSIFYIFFLLALYFAITTVKPLSSKAIKETDKELLNKEKKPWVNESLIYYRGLINFVEKNHAIGKSPLTEFYNILTVENITKDLIKQTFILSEYSDYKRRRLEKAVSIGLISIFFLVITIICFLIALIKYS